MFDKIWKRGGSFLPVVFILGVTLVAYWGTFANGFFGDDRQFILEWQAIRSPENIPALLAGENPVGHENTYRPVRSILYLVLFHLFGTNPLPYHLYTVLVHLLITALVYLLVITLKGSKSLAFTTALLFGLHPIHVEAVTFTTAGIDTTGFIFFTLAFLAYLNQSSRAVLVWSMLAFFTNETTLVLPLILTAYEFVQHKSLSKVRRAIPRIAPVALGALVYLFIRTTLAGVTTKGTYLAESFFLTQLVSLKAFLLYLKVLLFPNDYSFIHTLPGNISTYSFPELNYPFIVKQTFFEPAIFLAIGVLSLLGLFVLKYRHKRLPSLSLIFFVIALLPVMNLIPTALIFSERYAYLASIGFLMFLSVIISYVAKKINCTLCFVCIVAAISIWYFQETTTRIPQFQNDEVFWGKEIQNHPNHPVAHYQYAEALKANGKIDTAIHAYTQSIALAPIMTPSYLSLGDIYQSRGQYQDALTMYQKAYELNPLHPNLFEAIQLMQQKSKTEP